jgi:hypothetical protein
LVVARATSASADGHWTHCARGLPRSEASDHLAQRDELSRPLQASTPLEAKLRTIASIHHRAPSPINASRAQRALHVGPSAASSASRRLTPARSSRPSPNRARPSRPRQIGCPGLRALQSAIWSLVISIGSQTVQATSFFHAAAQKIYRLHGIGMGNRESRGWADASATRPGPASVLGGLLTGVAFFAQRTFVVTDTPRFKHPQRGCYRRTACHGAYVDAFTECACRLRDSDDRAALVAMPSSGEPRMRRRSSGPIS